MNIILIEKQEIQGARVLLVDRQAKHLVKVLQVIDDRKGAGDVDIAGADVLVSGGRGMLAKENYKILQELADELGGAVAGTRSAVETTTRKTLSANGETLSPDRLSRMTAAAQISAVSKAKKDPMA